MPVSARPWEALPPELADALEPELPALAAEIIDALREAIREYALPLEGSFGRNVSAGVESALETFLRLMTDPPARRRPWPETYRLLGAGEWREGRSLDALQAAYRLGARVAWRRLSERATAAGFGAETLRLFAEAIFAYIDELAAESVVGYAAAQSAAAGAREERRRQLTDLLLAPGGPDLAALGDAARDAGWVVPRTIAVVAVGARTDVRALAARLGPDVLVGDGEDPVLLLVPDPGGPARRDALRGLPPGPVAIGPGLGVEQLPRSAARARAALALAGDGAPPVVAAERLADLALLDGAGPLADLAARRLGALAELTPLRRARLEETLLAWLRRGSAPAVAAELGVHPQTVRHRLGRLRDLLGDEALDAPDARFELELALRAARLAARLAAPAAR